MRHILLLLESALVLAALSTQPAGAQPTAGSPKAQFAADNRAALARYENDKKLCNDETSSAGRLQCRRDAKTEYDKALVQAKARLASASAAPATTTTPAAPACPECGHVVAVSVTEKAGEGGALGLIAGGAAGALLGKQIGSGAGKDLATIAGAVGGAYAGKKIEEKAKTHTVWSVSVQYNDASTRTVTFDHDPGFKVGDAVRRSGDTLVR